MPRNTIWIISAALVLTATFVIRKGMPNLVDSGLAFTGGKAVSTLRTIHWAQGLVRRGGYLDEDGDGVAEFASLRQLTGDEPIPTGERLAGLMEQEHAELSGDSLLAAGYCFRVELPREAHDRERRFSAYAWPIQGGLKGYCLDQDEAIFETALPPVPGCRAPSPPCAAGGPLGFQAWRHKTSRSPIGASVQ